MSKNSDVVFVKGCGGGIIAAASAQWSLEERAAFVKQSNKQAGDRAGGRAGGRAGARSICDNRYAVMQIGLQLYWKIEFCNSRPDPDPVFVAIPIGFRPIFDCRADPQALLQESVCKYLRR